MGRASVQVVLRDEVENLGASGEVVRVRPGYARNYLLPRGLAVVATRGSVKQIEHEKQAALVRAQKLRKESADVAATLATVKLQVEKKAGDEGKLYGSVTAQEISDALKAKGFEVDRRKIQMPDEAIKSLGEYGLTAKLSGGVVASFKVEVVGSAEG